MASELQPRSNRPAGQRSALQIARQVFGPIGQTLLYAVGSAAILSLTVLILAVLLRGPLGEAALITKTANRLPQVIFDGLSRGFIFASIALGYTMVYGVLEFINFAHGEVFMIGGFVAAGFGAFLEYHGMLATFSPLLFVILVVLLGMTVSGTVAVLMERVAYRPIRMRNAPRLVALITAVGMSLFLQDLMRMVATTSGLGFNAPVKYPNLGEGIRLFVRGTPNTFAFYRCTDAADDRVFEQFWLPSSTAFADSCTYAKGLGIILPFGEGLDALVFLRMSALILIVSAVFMLIGLNYLVNVTRLGKAIRAVSQDRATASLMGINANKIIVMTFLIGGALGGAVGALFGMFVGTINPYAGFIPGLKAFTAAVLGGIGNITGAVVGGIVLGFLEAFVASYLSLFTAGHFTGANYADIAAFSILIIILIFRPTGLLGESVTQKV